MKIIELTLPIDDTKIIEEINAGDKLLISGTLYTGRDAAHKRMIHAIEENEPLPFDVRGQGIYYVGPAPAKPGQVIGSCGPTTSYRMDDLTNPLLQRGLKVMIGKGERAPKVVEEMKREKAIYCAAIGGAGALIAGAVEKSEIIAYDDLGSEAVRKLTIKDLPVIVVIDSNGNNLYHSERKKYSQI